MADQESAPPIEGSIAKAIVDRIKWHGGYARKTHGSRYSAGWPDVVGCLAGRTVAIEVKRPGKWGAVYTPQQQAEIRKWQRAGAIAGKCTSIGDLDDLLARHGAIDLDTRPT